jgi:hypothetical protein
MCTVVLLVRPGHAWPVLLAANRDEMVGRPWDPPAVHWPDQPDVVAGRDCLGGGTWMGVNGAGVVAAVLNRPGSLGPAPGKRSRGTLPLLALRHGTAVEAAAALSTVPAGDYRSFNMIVADARGAYFLRGLDERRTQPRPLGEGVHMVTSHDPNDLASPRTARHLPRFRAAAYPDPGSGDWRAWREILADRSGPAGSEINIPERGGFATVCSALLAIAARGRPVWLFAPGPPDLADFAPV